MIGVIRTNAVKLETRVGYGEGVALYPTYTYANHNCMCNTHTRKIMFCSGIYYYLAVAPDFYVI